METGLNRGYWFTRFFYQRTLAFIYLIAFLVALNQFRALIGEKGLLPIPDFLSRTQFWDAPSLFWFHYSDSFFEIITLSGVILSGLALLGLSEIFGIWVSALVWFLLWILYQSIVNVGQIFYGFGWEMLLLEAGFLAIFLGSSKTEPPKILIWLLRWLLFRVMFGAGLIKIRGDACWRDLTCMLYHYETQPIPNPLSWYFHHLPPLFHQIETFCTHLIELVVPWGFFVPGWIGAVAGAWTVLFQFLLILSGNLSWLNYLTLTIAVSCFDDRFFRKLIPWNPPLTKQDSKLRRGLLVTLTVLICALSIPPAVNLVSPHQMMNASFEPFHLVNTYGAFGSITQQRMEIIFEGTNDPILTPSTRWEEYEFKCKPGDVRRRPCVVSPYHYRLDWLMWFAAMSDVRSYPWIFHLVSKLLEGDLKTLKLLADSPFPEPPQFIRAELYLYRFATPQERKTKGLWWSRTRVGSYLPPLSLNNPAFREILSRGGWLGEQSED